MFFWFKRQYFLFSAFECLSYTQRRHNMQFNRTPHNITCVLYHLPIVHVLNSHCEAQFPSKNIICTNKISCVYFHSQLEMWRSHIDARHNYWGWNESLAVAGRIKDRGDSPELLQVDYTPYHMNNETVLNGKCPPSWDLVGDTCYIYIGAPMDFYSAREFCRVSMKNNTML